MILSFFSFVLFSFVFFHSFAADAAKNVRVVFSETRVFVINIYGRDFIVGRVFTFAHSFFFFFFSIFLGLRVPVTYLHVSVSF